MSFSSLVRSEALLAYDLDGPSDCQTGTSNKRCITTGKFVKDCLKIEKNNVSPYLKGVFVLPT